MSNQRKGNYQKKETGMTSEMGVLKFFKTAAWELEKSGKSDESFYFEQVVDWLQKGYRLPTDQKNVIRCLGI